MMLRDCHKQRDDPVGAIDALQLRRRAQRTLRWRKTKSQQLAHARRNLGSSDGPQQLIAIGFA